MRFYNPLAFSCFLTVAQVLTALEVFFFFASTFMSQNHSLLLRNHIAIGYVQLMDGLFFLKILVKTFMCSLYLSTRKKERIQRE